MSKGALFATLSALSFMTVSRPSRSAEEQMARDSNHPASSPADASGDPRCRSYEKRP
jgi:hypothetical protein